MTAAGSARAQVAAGLVLLLFGLGVAWQAAAQLQLGEPLRPGPGFYPLGLGIVLVLLAAWRVVEARVARVDSGPVGPTVPIAPILATLGLVLTFALLLEPLGFIPTSLLVVGLLVRVAGLSWRSSAIVAITSSILSYILFDLLLGLQLPTGILEPLL